MNKAEAEKQLDKMISFINVEEKQEIFVSSDIFRHVGSFYKGFHVVKWFQPEYKKPYLMSKRYHK